MMTEVSPKQIAPKTKSGVVVPHAPHWHQRLGALLIHMSIRAYAMTLRLRWDGRSQLTPNILKGQAIYCLWHNRLLLCMEAYEQQSRRQDIGKGLAALIS